MSQESKIDIVVLKTETVEEKFVVLNDATHIDPKASEGTTALLALKGLNSSFYQETNQYSYCITHKYSQNKYWDDNIIEVYDSSKDGAQGDDDYSVAYYVNNYVLFLQNHGFTGVQSGRILFKSELETGGIAELYKDTGYYYWLGTYAGWTRVWSVKDNGDFNDARYDGESGLRCTRPVIYINTSDIE